jgi:hypothetical protein
MSVKTRAKRTLLPAPGVRTILAGPARGVRMRIDFGHQTRTYLGLYELELNRYLRRFLQCGAAAFDVGGQHGFDALLIARQTRGPVASFECDPECVARMRKNFALNDASITAVPGFVGRDVRLDDWAFGPGFVPDFIKVDIDGGEAAALRSASRVLDERHPSLVVEVHSQELEAECGALLVEHGYRPVIVNQRLLWPDLRPIAHNRWLVAEC